MSAPVATTTAPVFDEALLDELARVFMRAALADLLREQEETMSVKADKTIDKPRSTRRRP
jgi:hypothetical protein